MNDLSFPMTCEIIGKSPYERTQFEKLIVAAIGFFGSAINEYDRRFSFINFVICLESLLLKEREPQKGLLAERVAIIIQGEASDRIDTSKRMENFYQLRSNFVHRGVDNITQIDITLISHYAFEVINRLISYSKEINDIGKLIQMINESKFRGPSFQK